MKTIQVVAHLKIHPGKLDQFKTIAEKCVKIVREKDTGTLQYDWYLDKDETSCEVIEKYQDSDAALTHMMNLGDSLGELLAICDFSLDIYGSLNEELKNALAGMAYNLYDPFLNK